jgi:TolB protein
MHESRSRRDSPVEVVIVSTLARLFTVGSVALALCLVPASSVRAAFPGENGQIAFTRYELGDQAGQVAIAQATTNADVEILTSEGSVNGTAEWSADGSCITFSSNRDAGNQEVYVMTANGSDQTRIAVIPAYDYDSTFSPDGKKLLYVSECDGDREIYSFDLATANTKQLTSNGSADGDPVWSPDGTRIVFSSQRDGNYEIYVMNADGSNQTRLTQNPGVDIYPDWSPDGKKIAFATVREGTLARDIWIMDADGLNQAPLIARPGNDSEPAFSPDGTRFAFSGDDNTASSHIYVAKSTDGSDLVQVTTSVDVDDRAPDWQSIHNAAPAALCPTSTPVVLCGDAVAEGTIKASDALYVLRAAVGGPLCCPPVRCDTDASGDIVASDALRVLRFSVGQPVDLTCPTE